MMTKTPASGDDNYYSVPATVCPVQSAHYRVPITVCPPEIRIGKIKRVSIVMMKKGAPKPLFRTTDPTT
jgi:hypothetical protein